MTPLVSVMMPVYNHARYVAEAVASVAGQDYARVELVALDDGSDDGSAESARAEVARHPGRFERVVIERQANAGLTRTLNRLVGMCRGDYVTMLASDDLLLPGALTRRVTRLEADPEALAVFTDCVVVDGDGRRTHPSGIRDLWGGDPTELTVEPYLAASLVLKWSVPGPVITVRRAAYDPAAGVGPYDERLRYEDYDFYLRLAARGALRFDPAPTAAYRWHGANYSSTTDRAFSLAQMDAALAQNVPRMRGTDRLVAKVQLESVRHLRYTRRDPRRMFWSLARRAVVRWHAGRVRRALAGRPTPIPSRP